jgi:hypothetical protein
MDDYVKNDTVSVPVKLPFTSAELGCATEESGVRAHTLFVVDVTDTANVRQLVDGAWLHAQV